jgi:TonB family protein
MRICVFLLLLAPAYFSSLAASEDVMTVEEAVQKRLLLVAARPDYSYEARSRKRSGSGLFELKFDYESGRLREVHVVRSIGDPLLDGPAIAALKIWQAKPRSIHTLLVPIRFVGRDR